MYVKNNSEEKASQNSISDIFRYKYYVESLKHLNNVKTF